MKIIIYCGVVQEVNIIKKANYKTKSITCDEHSGILEIACKTVALINSKSKFNAILFERRRIISFSKSHLLFLCDICFRKYDSRSVVCFAENVHELYMIKMWSIHSITSLTT